MQTRLSVRASCSGILRIADATVMTEWSSMHAYNLLVQFWLQPTLPSQSVMCRGVITMEQPCMRAYSQLLIKTCHRRGIFAMGGMSAQIPVKNNPQANETALQKVI